MKKVISIIIVTSIIILSFYMLISVYNNKALASVFYIPEYNTMTWEKLEVEFKPEYPNGEVSRDIYKYGFDSYGVYVKHLKNLGCVRAWGDSSMYVSDKLKLAGPDLLHRLTMKIELNGENAKFYAGEGYWLNVDDNPDNDVKAGTLIYEANCKENDIMAAACYHAAENSDQGQVADNTLGDLLWYYWDTWLDASLGLDKSFIQVRENWGGHNDEEDVNIAHAGDWFDAMVLSDGTIMDLTHSRYVSRTQLIKQRSLGEL